MKANQENNQRAWIWWEDNKEGVKGLKIWTLEKFQSWLIDITPDESTEDDLMDMSASKPEPDDEEGDTELTVLENIQTVDRHYEVFLSSYIEDARLSCLPPP